MEGKIVLVVFPQDSSQKRRPALVLREFPKYGDLLICAISTQTGQYISGFDLLLNSTHPDFPNSGLKAASVCRLGVLSMVPINSIAGTIGQIQSQTHTNLLKNLAGYLIKNIS